MSGRVRSKGFHTTFQGTKMYIPPVTIMEGTKAWELYHSKKAVMKVPGAETLEYHLAECDVKWRRMEDRKPFLELTERERMLEGGIPWDPVRLKELDDEHYGRTSV